MAAAATRATSPAIRPILGFRRAFAGSVAGGSAGWPVHACAPGRLLYRPARGMRHRPYRGPPGLRPPLVLPAPVAPAVRGRHPGHERVGSGPDQAQEQVAGRRAHGRILGRAMLDRRPEGDRNPRDVRVRRHDLVQHGGDAVAAEGPAAGRGEDDRGAPREDIGGRARRASGDLLGSQVGRSADRPRSDRFTLALPGDAEVDHARAVRAEQDVARLDVTVHDPGGVDRGQGGRGADREPLQLATPSGLPSPRRPVRRNAPSVVGSSGAGGRPWSYRSDCDRFAETQSSRRTTASASLRRPASLMCKWSPSS
jgi:hypothetical protein